MLHSLAKVRDCYVRDLDRTRVDEEYVSRAHAFYRNGLGMMECLGVLMEAVVENLQLTGSAAFLGPLVSMFRFVGEQVLIDRSLDMEGGRVDMEGERVDMEGDRVVEMFLSYYCHQQQ